MSSTKPSVSPWGGRGRPDRRAADEIFRHEGLTPRAWSNGPGDRYGWHEHGFHKVLVCLSGEIVLHTRDGDVALSPGDRLDLPPATPHAATVGPKGVECLEAARDA